MDKMEELFRALDRARRNEKQDREFDSFMGKAPRARSLADERLSLLIERLADVRYSGVEHAQRRVIPRAVSDVLICPGFFVVHGDRVTVIPSFGLPDGLCSTRLDWEINRIAHRARLWSGTPWTTVTCTRLISEADATPPS